jgi:hypothetical protein
MRKVMTRLDPGAGATISWEPDSSPQVMIVITSSLELLLKLSPVTGTV